VPSLGILLGASVMVEFAAALLSSIVLGWEEKSSVQREVCYQRTEERAEILLWSKEHKTCIAQVVKCAGSCPRFAESCTSTRTCDRQSQLNVIVHLSPNGIASPPCVPTLRIDRPGEFRAPIWADLSRGGIQHYCHVLHAFACGVLAATASSAWRGDGPRDASR
jgi:hypothetical protein